LEQERFGKISTLRESTQTVQQNPVIQNFVNSTRGPLTTEEIQTITENVLGQIRENQTNQNTISSNLFYKPTRLPDRKLYGIEIKYDLRVKLMFICMAWGGGWAGVTINPMSNFLDKVERFQLIPKELLDEINTLLALISTSEFWKDIPDDLFLDIEYLSTKIINQLDQILKEPYRDDSYLKKGAVG